MFYYFLKHRILELGSRRISDVFVLLLPIKMIHILSRFWTVLPRPLKIHQSTLKLFDLEEFAISSWGIKKSVQYDNLIPFQLVIENSLSIGNKIDSDYEKTLAKASKSIFESLSSTHPSIALNHASQFGADISSTGGHNMWSHFALELNTDQALLLQEDICSFSQLRFKQSRSTITIDNLSVLLDSPHPQACYASLLATLMNDHHVLDVRATKKNKALNDFNKGIVQAGERAHVFPYHDAGLVGTNEVVGVGDTGGGGGIE